MYTKYKSHLKAALVFLTSFTLLFLISFFTKPNVSDIKKNNQKIEGILFVANGGMRDSGFIKIGQTTINLSTDSIGSPTGSTALRGVDKNKYVTAESVIVPTLLKDRVIVTKIADEYENIVYERSLERVICLGLMESLRLSFLVCLIFASISFFFIFDRSNEIKKEK